MNLIWEEKVNSVSFIGNLQQFMVRNNIEAPVLWFE